MSTTAEMQGRTLKRGQKVKVLADLPGVPAGTQGKVAMANGFTWNRYWVRFDNGHVVGHVDHHNLVQTKDYERFLVAQVREAELAEIAAAQAATAEAAGPEAASSDSDGGSDPVINGVPVPAYLIERSADARVRLGG